MASTVFVQNSIGLGYRVQLSRYDHAIVVRDVIVSSENTVAIYGVSGENSVIVEGTVTSRFKAIQLGDAVDDENSSVYVSATGSVSAITTAIDMQGRGAFLVNEGSIASSGVAVAFTLDPALYAGAELHNSGIISGRSGVSVVSGALSIENSGTIQALRPTWSGYSAIAGGDGNDAVTNTGLIAGTVRLGGGRDTFDTSAGRIKGSVYGGDGEDRLTGSKQADSLFGEAQDDRLIGNGGDDYLDGGSGDDRLQGGSGDDDLRGGDGDDTFDGGSGGDYMVGGKGNDQYFVNRSDDTVVERAGEGLDTVATSISYTLRAEAEIEFIFYFPFVSGNGSSTDAYAKPKKAVSLTGNDYGQTLDSSVSTGNDTLKGLGGNDRLFGGIGADKLYGGAGKDTFVFRSVTDSTVAKKGRDTIYDFNGKNGDRIDLAQIDANTKVNGDQAFTFIGTQKFHKKAGELRYDKKASDTYIYGDTNGDGKGDFAIHLDDALTFSKGYFLL